MSSNAQHRSSTQSTSTAGASSSLSSADENDYRLIELYYLRVGDDEDAEEAADIDDKVLLRELVADDDVKVVAVSPEFAEKAAEDKELPTTEDKELALVLQQRKERREEKERVRQHAQEPSLLPAGICSFAHPLENRADPPRTPSLRRTSSSASIVPPAVPAEPLCLDVFGNPIVPSYDLCVVCSDPILGKVVYTPCGHHYDGNCLVDLFLSRMAGDQFPPQCCGRPVPVAMVTEFVGADVAADFSAKAAECATPDRVYCASRPCSRFLGAKTKTRGAVVCPCGAETCGACSEAAHGDEPCRANEAARKVLLLGQKKGWQRCPGCHRIVERHQGCPNMLCRCGTSFCYLCGGGSRQCSCTERRRFFFFRVRRPRAGVRRNYLLGDDELDPLEGKPLLVRVVTKSWRGLARTVSQRG